MAALFGISFLTAAAPPLSRPLAVPGSICESSFSFLRFSNAFADRVFIVVQSAFPGLNKPFSLYARGRIKTSKIGKMWFDNLETASDWRLEKKN
ncbi:MAG: hypothetical protein IK099_10745 [Clostridia bacterium]|nr:hypothetical protein [Clostridia bacterium]